MLLYSIQAIKEDFRRLKSLFSLAERRSHVTVAALLKAAFNNGSRTNKTHQNIRRKRNVKEKRRGKKRKEKKKKDCRLFHRQSVECLMKFLEEVPRPLERKTQNHSVLGSDREEDSRRKRGKGRQTVKHKKGTTIKKVGPELFGPRATAKTSPRDLFYPVLNQNT